MRTARSVQSWPRERSTTLNSRPDEATVPASMPATVQGHVHGHLGTAAEPASADSARKIASLFECTAVDPAWSFAEYKPSETAKWTHGYHRYPAKFVPQLVEKLLDIYMDGSTGHINDPFVGSGTTLVSALSRGHFASGTDVNRAAILIAETKCTPIEPFALARGLDRFYDRACSLAPDTGILLQALQRQNELQPIVPTVHKQRIEYWFEANTIEELGRILAAIKQEADPRIQRFLLVAFSHVLKNCSRWLQASTKPTRDQKKQPKPPFAAIRLHLRKMQRGNLSFFYTVPSSVRSSLETHLKVTASDARMQPLESGSVDMVITSSPYVTSYEYSDLHQLSTIWLELADDLVEYSRAFIGSAKRAATMSLPDDQAPTTTGASTILRLGKVSDRLAKDVAAFFWDMEAVIRESHRVLRSGGRACYVIGDTKLRGVDIPNARVFAELMVDAGFEIDSLIRRQIPSKILPQTRDAKTGRFASRTDCDTEAYPTEFIVVGRKN